MTQTNTILSPGGKSRGRHRSLEAEAAILKATRYLLDRFPLSKITADAIAARAKVSKATLYKWWPNKNCVALDALFNYAQQKVPVPNTGAIHRDLTDYFHAATAFYSTRPGRFAVEFIAESINDASLRKLFLERLQQPRRDEVKIMFERAIHRNEIHSDVDFETLMDLIIGPLFFRIMSQHLPADKTFVNNMVNIILTGISST